MTALVAPAEPARPIWRDAALVLFVCIIVYWLYLGAAPFASSEGHRVIPGWMMLDSGDWSRTEMFGLNYIRKPPGMAWAIAASSALLGQNEFAARAPSAFACTLMALVALAFGRAWCGARGGLAAGLAQALLPVMWVSGGAGRSAEIEALNTFCTQIAVLPLIALMLPSRARELGTLKNARRGAALAVLSALGITGFALTKSLASAPCIVGAIIGICIARRSARPLACLWMWSALLLGTGAAYLALRHFGVMNYDPGAVREEGSFLWNDPARVVTVIPMALLAALPASLAVLFAFGKDARAEGDSTADPAWSRCVLAARACAFAFAASCLLYAAIGVGNHRYLLPATVFLAPIIGYVIRGLAGGGQGPFARAGFNDERRVFFKRLIIRGPVAWAAVLLSAALLINVAGTMRDDTDTGRAAGIALAQHLPDSATLWADDLIEARPDVLLYARRAAAASGRSLTCIWAKQQMLGGELPAPTAVGSFILIRTDAESGEALRYLPAIESGRLRPLHRGKVGKYAFAVFRVAGATEVMR